MNIHRTDGYILHPHEKVAWNRKRRALLETVAAIRKKAAHVVIVSNEVLGRTCLNAMKRRGLLQVDWQAPSTPRPDSDDAIEMDSGMPSYWKKEGLVTVR